MANEERKYGRNATEGLNNDRFSGYGLVRKSDSDGLWYRVGGINGLTEGEAISKAAYMNRYYDHTLKHSVIRWDGYIYQPEDFQ